MSDVTLFFLRIPAESPAEEPAPGASCRHDWSPVPAPPDAGSPWFRCSRCPATGYRKRGRGPVRAYRCSVKECPNIAAARLPGRLARGAMIWRCASHAEAPARAAAG